MVEVIIVAGVSASGKTAFTEKHLMPEFRSRGLGPDKDIDVKNFEQVDDVSSVSAKSVCVVLYNTQAQSDCSSVETMSASREQKLFGLASFRPEATKVYLCYTPDPILMERIKAQTEVEPNGFPGNINQRQALLRLAEKLVPVVSDVQIVFSARGKASLMTVDEFKYGLPSEKLEAVISNTTILDSAKNTVLRATRNTVLRSIFIALRHRWRQIRSSFRKK